MLSADLFTRKRIREALKAWHNSPQLGQHPLASLPAVGVRRQQEQYADTAAGRGIALRHLLREAIQQLKPAGEQPDFTQRAWRHYTILYEQFLNDQRAQDLQALLGISESGYFLDQREALDRLADWLREQNSHLATPETASAEPLAVPLLPPSNLPHPPTPFIGRTAERAQIGAWLANDDCRLISLIGGGGMGKTRLAIQAAQENGRPAYFVPLEGVETADLLLPTIAHALQFAPHTHHTHAAQLHHFLRGKPLLLVLDNFEHLAQTGAEWVSELLHHAPDLKLLVTSRERLQIRGEWVIELYGLDVPTTLTADPAQFSAGQLFAQALSRVRAGKPPSPADWPAICAICQQVQGMPLGLELAASWGSVMSCADIAAEIQANLDFLASSYRDLPPRHRSLRAVFGHSWALLTAEEQKVFGRLAVFRGDFDRQAAQAIAGATLPLLHALSNKSLLRQTAEGRYAIHPLLRQYAREQLAQHGAEEAQVREKHGRYYLRFLQQQLPALKQGHQQPEALQRTTQEMENWRAAWRWAVETYEMASLLATAEPLSFFLSITGRASEGRESMGLALAMLDEAQPTADHTLHAYLLGLRARFDYLLGYPERARPQFRRSLARLRESGRSALLALISLLAIEANLTSDEDRPAQLYGASMAYFEQMDDPWGIASSHMRFVTHLRLIGATDTYGQQKTLLQHALAIREEIGDQRGVANTLNFLCSLAYERGDYEEARQHASRSLALHHALGNALGRAQSLSHLGQVAGTLGDYEQALQHYEASLVLFRQYGNARDVAVCLDSVGYVSFLREDYETAARRYKESFHISREMGDEQGVAWSLHNLGDVERVHGRYEAARELYQQSLALHKALDPVGWGGIVASDKLGQVALEGGELAAAEAYFSEALHMATATHRKREMMDAKLNLAIVALRRHAPAQAAPLLAEVANHPATAKQTRDKAEDLLAFSF